jgi:hypothetical protein
MIRCHRTHLEQRCAQRGYTLEEVAGCIQSREGDYLVVDETHAAYPSERRRQRAGLGDMVAAGLSAVGITPERVSAAMGVKDCGCKKRQQQLNALGRRLGIG